MLRETKPVVTDDHKFEYSDKSRLLALLDPWYHYSSEASMKVNECSNKFSYKVFIVYWGKIRPVVTDKFEVEPET